MSEIREIREIGEICEIREISRKVQFFTLKYLTSGPKCCIFVVATGGSVCRSRAYQPLNQLHTTDAQGVI